MKLLLNVLKEIPEESLVYGDITWNEADGGNSAVCHEFCGENEKFRERNERAANFETECSAFLEKLKHMPKDKKEER